MRWNWDAPLIISPHSNTRLYFGAQRLYRSDDRGDSWRAVSGDLTRNLDRNKLPVMGKIWPVGAVGKNVSTALYDNISALAESPLQEGLIYVGTDDGLLQITQDGGKTWQKEERPAGVPADAYVQRIVASQHEAGGVYVAYENHQNGDFKPYLLKSSDKGNTWTNIAGDLPERGGVYAIAEDHKNAKLLFAGTEFGLYFSQSGGGKWIKLAAGLPTIMVRDLSIQRQMDDLIVGTFGRGIYVLDDYGPLREAIPEALEKEAILFPVKTAYSYIPTSIFGGGRGAQGDAFFAAPNPPFGAVITYYLKDGYRTRREEREKREQDAIKKGDVPAYPPEEELRAEAAEEAPAVVLEIADSSGKVVRRLEGPAGPGIHRVAWDLRGPADTLPAPNAARGEGDDDEESLRPRDSGALVAPGHYTLTTAKRVEGVVTALDGSQRFEVVAEGPTTNADRLERVEFEEKLAKLHQALVAAEAAVVEARAKLQAIRRALDATPSLPFKVREQVLSLERQLDAIQTALNGDSVVRAHNEGSPASIGEHVQGAVGPLRGNTGRPPKTALEQYQIASDGLATQIPILRKLTETGIPALEKQLDAAGAPPTPGRLPEWKR
jgi:hypothetical protein